MSDLTQKKCAPCEGGAALSPEQSQSMLKRVGSHWKLADDNKSIRAEWKFKNFFHAMSFLNAVAHIANAEDHHPDLEVGWGYCRVKYNTHAVGGLSENDFICAAKIDALPTL